MNTALPRLRYGTLEAVKWLALVLMVLDHVDAFVFQRQLLWAGALGRLVFPLFAFVLGHHLSQPTVDVSVYRRVLARLALFAAIAQLPHGLLTGAAYGLFPLNVLATFAVAVGVMWLIERGQGIAALLLALVGGGFVEYQWPGVLLCVAVWTAYRRPGVAAFAFLGFAWASLEVINGSFLALWAVPVVLLASRLDLAVPRLRWAFYGFYPAHLAAFVVLLPLL